MNLYGAPTPVHGEIVRHVAQIMASMLVAGLWQSAFLAAGVALMLKVVPRTTAATRFAIWTMVFCLSAIMPFAGRFFGPATLDGAAVTNLRVDPRWSYLLAAVWFVAALARLAGLATQGWMLRLLWNRAVPVADETLAMLQCDALLVQRKVRVCTSEDVDRPCVVGFFAPRILVPEWLLEQLSEVQLRHIVLHEMEHLRRKDDWINLLQKIGLVVFPLNPALFWVDLRLAAERELACDDGVLRRTKTPRAYAGCLASIAEMQLGRRIHRRVVALAIGVLGVAGLLRGQSEFSRRIESILGRKTVVSPMIAGIIASVLMTSVLAAGVRLARVPQLLSFAPIREVESTASLAPATPEPLSVNGVGDAVEEAHVRNASFHVQELGGMSTSTKQAVVRDRQVSLPARTANVPQRLKLSGEGGTYGMAKATPLTQRVRVEATAGNLQDEQPKWQTRQAREQWLVLTSFDDDVPARVVVRLDDGGFYIAPYAAVPVRDGWLIVQL